MITAQAPSRTYILNLDDDSTTDSNRNIVERQGFDMQEELEVEAEEECKIVIIGDCGVGKTKITRQIGNDGYLDFYMKTLGIDFENITINVFDTAIQCKIIDTSGQQRFAYLLSTHAKSANVVLFVYDITNVVTFQNIKIKWLPLLTDTISSECLLVLVGNQCDKNQYRAVKCNKAKQWAHKMGMLFMETSAKNNVNINKLLIDTVKQSIAKQDLSVIPGQNMLYLNMDSNILAMHNVITGIINAPFLDLFGGYALDNPLCLDMQLMYDMVRNDVSVTRICDIIRYFAKTNVAELYMENFAVKPIYDVIKDILCPKLRKCVITKSPFRSMDDCNNYMLHAVALNFVQEFDCYVDDLLLRTWMNNHQNAWDLFVKAMDFNRKLKSLQFCIANVSNDCQPKLCDLFWCIQEKAHNLNHLVLLFESNIHIKDLNELHLFLIQCIVSKRKHLETLSWVW